MAPMTIFALLALSLAAGEMERFQVAGEWCFLRAPAAPTTEAVLLIHGNGQTVDAKTSSMEQTESTRRFLDALVAKGYVVAQSNHGATRTNGMWGNAKTQDAVLALANYLRDKRGIRKIHAAAISAGNATLLNLALDAKVQFATAVLIAPVISLESMYRCPGGTDRVTGIAEAFVFRPAAACPGDPLQDTAFRTATAGADPLRRIRAMTPAALKTRLSATRWMSLYSDRDPKVLPEENILPLAKLLRDAGVLLELRSVNEAAHSADEVLKRYTSDVLRLLAAGQ